VGGTHQITDFLDGVSRFRNLIGMHAEAMCREIFSAQHGQKYSFCMAASSKKLGDPVLNTFPPNFIRLSCKKHNETESFDSLPVFFEGPYWTEQSFMPFNGLFT
jgi:hypothetical protein